MSRLWLVALLAGCGPSRLAKFLAPDAYVLPDAPTGRLATVTYDTGWRNDPPQRWSAERRIAEGRLFVDPVTVTSRGWLRVDPLVPDATVRLYVRHHGLTPHDFLPVVAVTGGLDRAIPNEIRPLPTGLDGTFELPFHQLDNVYAAFDYQDGDLLLVEVDAPDADAEHYLFRTRQTGLRSKGGAGVLFRVPLPGEEITTSPVFVATLAFGYRYPTQDPVLWWAGNKLGVVASVGVGSTAVLLADGDVDDQLGSVLNATLAGGGVELYDMLSVQVLANLTALGRNRAEQPATLAVGLDAVQFGLFTRDAGRRLFSSNRLDGGSPKGR